MGFRTSWIARAGSSTHELLQVLGLSPNGERDEDPDVGCYLVELQHAGSPWVLLLADGSEHYMKLGPEDAQALSEGGNRCLYYWCSETVMMAQLRCFMDGVEMWSIVYDCEDPTMRPAMAGDLPEEAHERLRERQAQGEMDEGVDYMFDLPGDIGKHLVGFRIGESLETDDHEPFQQLGSEF